MELYFHTTMLRCIGAVYRVEKRRTLQFDSVCYGINLKLIASTSLLGVIKTFDKWNTFVDCFFY